MALHHSGYWRDAVRSTKTKTVYAWGLNLVVLTLQIQPPWGGEPLGLPINMRLHRKKEASLIELAEQMIREVIQWFPERRFRVVADGFYATLAGKDLPHTTIISRMQRNAELYDLPTQSRKKQRGWPRKKGKRLLSPEKMARYVRHWEKVKIPVRGRIADAIACLRRERWRERIKCMFGATAVHDKKFEFLLEALAPAA